MAYGCGGADLGDVVGAVGDYSSVDSDDWPLLPELVVSVADSMVAVG